MTSSIEPWSLAPGAAYTETPSAYVRDARGQIIAVFRDYRDAERLFHKIEVLENLVNELESVT